MKPKVLFIGDKWCAGDKNFGIAEWETNLFVTLQESSLAEMEAFNFDNYYIENKVLGDEACIAKISEYKPEMIVIVLYKMPGEGFNVPRWKTISKIKNEYHIPIVAIWGDLENAKQVRIAKALAPFTALNLATASYNAVRRINMPDKFVYMWVPKNPNIFNNPHLNNEKERDINFSYAGTPKLGRLKVINHLIKNGVKVFHTGGERQAHLTTEEYANIFKRSKITLSFSRASGSHVINARPFEALACGTMMLEEESTEAPKLYIPFVDYVPYWSKKDLVKKAKYYLEHDEERMAIERNGYEKTVNLYSAQKFWQFAINRVLNGGNLSPYTQEGLRYLENPDLSHLPKWRAYKLKFLDFIFKDNNLFHIYMGIKNALDWRYYKHLLHKILIGVASIFTSIFNRITARNEEIKAKNNRDGIPR